METSHLNSVKRVPVRKVTGCISSPISDNLSVEEPLEIRIGYGPEAKRMQKNISVTMRTPGNDVELAIGFLFTEGIILSHSDVKEAYHKDVDGSAEKQNIVQVEMAEDCRPNLMHAERHFYTTSSCGVCGKGSIGSIRTVSPFQGMDKFSLTLRTDVLYRLAQELQAVQNDFSFTGGIHASALFSMDGSLLLMREDVGRHNALDKLIGSAMANYMLPLNRHILLLSGRASFELIQKASMAGIFIVVAIGAPSSLAVDLAKEFDVTLMGFLKQNRFNIYHLSEHVIIPDLYESEN